MKPFSLPAGWEIKLFGQCIKKVKYTEKQPTKSFLPEGKFPIVSQEKELISGYSNNQNAVFSVKNPVVIFGDHTKVVKYIDFDFVIGADGVKILQPIEDINAKYFYYYLSHLHLRDLGYARHYKLLKECIVIYPSLPEQKRIVEKLDKIFAAIDKAKSQTEKNLQNAKDIFNNALHHTFFDLIQKSELMKLRDLLDITSSKRIFKHEYVEEGVPFYRTKEIKELAHGRSITLELFISRDKYQQIKEKFGVPQKNDLLVSAVGTIGEIYIVPDMNPFYFKDGNILWLKNYKRPILANYLKYALCSYISQIQALAKGTAYNALTIEKLADYRVPYINIDLQQNLILHLDTVYTKTQELEKIYTQKLADLEELKQAVLQQAFSGKL